MQKKANLKFTNILDIEVLLVSGYWDKYNIFDLENHWKLPTIKTKKLMVDFEKLESMDTFGARFFLELNQKLDSMDIEVSLKNISQRHLDLLEFCAIHHSKIKPKISKNLTISDVLYNLGKLTQKRFNSIKRFLNFTGGVMIYFLKLFTNHKNFRFTATIHHIETNALNAIGIISLTSLLVGVVLAYQGSIQLAQFGANIFIVDMVGISATREIAPLIAAIVIAGRSASSFTAQIGVMKITDEIDAMNVMGFDKYNFIILPRVIALIVSMPLLVVVADILSIFGGMVIADINLGITYAEFVSRFKETVDLKHILIGLIKAPIFGWIIAMIGCFRGFEVKNTTQSIGVYTTKSVVNAIFWVIAFNALFSVFLTELGI